MHTCVVCMYVCGVYYVMILLVVSYTNVLYIHTYVRIYIIHIVFTFHPDVRIILFLQTDGMFYNALDTLLDNENTLEEAAKTQPLGLK